MKIGRLVTHYFAWHYSAAFVDLWRVCTNFLWFIYTLFSISFLLETFFDPFQRIQESHHSGEDVNDFFATTVVNILMRIVGMIMRFFIILMGLVALLFALLLGICTFVLWPLLPFVVVVMFALGTFQLI